jgi:hypothetical protein
MMKFPWFRRYGLFFIPVKFPGWLILSAAVLYAVIAFIDIDGRSHSVSDTLRPFIFHLIILFAIYSVTGWLACKKPKAE